MIAFLIMSKSSLISTRLLFALLLLLLLGMLLVVVVMLLRLGWLLVLLLVLVVVMVLLRLGRMRRLLLRMLVNRMSNRRNGGCVQNTSTRGLQMKFEKWQKKMFCALRRRRETYTGTHTKNADTGQDEIGGWSQIPRGYLGTTRWRH